jgi:Domain of unknown function (DUF3291)
MNTSRFHLAQANVARMRAPLEDPVMEGFRSQLDRINAMPIRVPDLYGGSRPPREMPQRSAPTTTNEFSSTCRSGILWRLSINTSIEATT